MSVEVCSESLFRANKVSQMPPGPDNFTESDTARCPAVGRATGRIQLALGANLAGPWGSPTETIRRAIAALGRVGVVVEACSPLYATAPVGDIRQPAFLNAVVTARGSLAPTDLLRVLKRLERDAGRRTGVRWGPRPLDIDILDHGGRRLGGRARHTLPGRLVLPHPELHRRGFVLVPLAQLNPHWRHPVLHLTARQLLARQPTRARGVRAVGRLQSRR